MKIKKDYLNEGQMADSADLVVLGAFYGTGNKGNIYNILIEELDRNLKSLGFRGLFNFYAPTQRGWGH